ncbi:hypothetical protein NIES2135_64110 (plasmid) [Leptolyngbya boryana NIES-2135]|jgi:DNA-binding XRE family transcriptional regulator|uniref:HTH cro/C1-type domain-containing protein n=1 Tax=Leptolyngbya boryana NIES-2135 TaxID=1973484 RepID=A0A1Z4JS50_LEPBY|nr:MULTISPECIES: helix-turn-helix transcriptional regulator [Leptolyngbya]BAY59534.1 hypothetical protein NIES2135_64110 [Leptolyngbya boryana NIES-2135]MBD2371292.1 helix-turn-helix transcriptional regulator [Leptolyngbya sp. FACHB-161]MBD2377770.1 helix-turn-helix transcriptional regulator [Leptolyngbya sp. FACHB-238]MBD2402208.1 helix-turn-helix transcriptional regulator [Leptolyngbya sp. FACHB-239]MBD2408701.1 helix-turn-helix transcriptional regulator [Leptolyngbya sp. FACHB-402]
MGQKSVTNTWIKQLREEANLTQEQLAVRLNIASSTLRTWEQGKVQPSMTIEQWEAFSEAVNVPLNELRLQTKRSA